MQNTDKLEYQRDEHRVHLIVYHLIWCPRRRKAVLVGEIAKRARQIIDRNASLVIGQRLITRSQKSQEKPHAPLATERIAKAVGVVVCQDAKGEEGPSILQARHADGHEHGTAHDVWLGMAEHTSDIPHPLRARES